MHMQLTTTLSLTVFPALIIASLVNVTVDDSQTSTITYEPADVWNVGNGCSACTAHPDPDQILDKTWHDTTWYQGSSADSAGTATITFTGVAVYVYCIIAHTLISPHGNSDMTFFVDGSEVGSFVLAPTNQSTYAYNYPVYSATGLSPGSHVFTLRNGGVGAATSLVLLDYIVYTHDDEAVQSVSPPALSPSSISSSPPQVQPTASVVDPKASSFQVIPTSTTPLISQGGTAAAPSLPSTQHTQSTSFASEATSVSLETIISISTNSLGIATIVEISSSSSPSSTLSPSSSTSSHPPSDKTRTVILACAVSGGVILLIVVSASVCWFCRRQTRRTHSSHPQREIADGPGSSGWPRNNGWILAAAATTPPAHEHSTHIYNEPSTLTSTFFGEPTRSSVGETTSGVIGEMRGPPTSSASTAVNDAPGYSHSSARDYHHIDPSTNSESTHMAESVIRGRHPPYGGPTSEPDSMEEYLHELGAVSETGATQSRGLSRISPASTEFPPSYDDLSRHDLDSLRHSLHDEKL